MMYPIWHATVLPHPTAAELISVEGKALPSACAAGAARGPIGTARQLTHFRLLGEGISCSSEEARS
jgi:hypothetical protein